ncbi:flagellar FlbD family protein [Brachyspira sp.]|uniref:flagellar FlbD family protein n=1 Tax=Brachyspira sp. TaxID=1977261 RepID=UPI002618B5BB|nr:flagellar FlbD family protein [Brachyspira sp.]
MIHITRFDGSILYVNPHQIEFMEETPDLVITMLSGRKVVTKDSFDTVLNRIIEYRTRIVNEDNIKKPSFYGSEE